jgi:hypothetical protein
MIGYIALRREGSVQQGVKGLRSLRQSISLLVEDRIDRQDTLTELALQP